MTKDVIAEITQENLLLKNRPDLLGEKMTEIFKEIRSAVISAESTASFPVTRILRILGIARAWYYRHLDSDSKEDRSFNPYAVRDADWIQLDTRRHIQSLDFESSHMQ